MRLSHSLTASIVLSGSSFAQTSWIQQSAAPADVNLHGVWFMTPDHGFITGADDLFMQTTDGGESWAQVSGVVRDPQFSEDPIWDLQMVNDQRGYAVGNTIYRTSNGGQTWQNLGSLGTIYGVDFVTPDAGFARSNLSVMRTTNAGASWDMVWDWQDFDPVADMDFFDQDLGVVVGAQNGQPGVFRTTNAGGSWQRISDESFGTIVFVNEDVLVATRQTSFYRSTDGGVTWSLVFSDDTEPVNSMEELRLIDSDSLAAIDINARIWMSHDAGETWTRTYGPLGNWGFEWDIQFADSMTGYAAGRLGLVLKTTDGGQSWKQISHGAAAQINDILMLPTGVGIAVGNSGVILRTDDFGRQWDLLSQANVNGFASHLNSVKAIGTQTVVAAGDAFFRSDDAGLTWAQGGTLPGTVNDLSFVDGEEGWIFGSLEPPFGYIAHTTDGGQSWALVPEGQLMTPAQEGEVMPSGRGWSLYPQTEQAITDDGFDQSFIPRELPGGDSWQEFDFADDNVGWYGGFFGSVLKSTTGGFIFQSQVIPGLIYGSDRGTDVVALSVDEAYIASVRPGANYQGRIFRTLDGGSSWTLLDPISSPTNQFAGAISEIAVLATGEIWAMASNGYIFASSEPDLPAPGDTNGDGVVNVTDLLAVLAEWGACGDCGTCSADLTGDCLVDVSDLLEVLANWSST